MRVLAMVAFVLAAVPALADPIVAPGNGGGASLRLFRPAVDSKGFFSVNASPILGHLDLSFGLVADGGLGLLPVAGADAVPTSFTGTLHGNVGLWNLGEVGLQLPVGILEVERLGDIGRDGRVPGLVSSDACFSGPPTDPECRTVAGAQDLAEIVVHGKLRILRVERSPVGMAIVVQAGFPLADSRTLLTDPGGSVWPSVVLDAQPSRRLRLGANVGYRVVLGEGSTIGGQGDPGRFTYDDHTTVGVGASFALVPGALEVVAETYAHRLAGGAAAGEGLVGLKVFVERNSYLSLAAGTAVLDGFDSADTRLVLGFVFEPSIGDADGDGIKDDVDRCVLDPEDWDAFEDEDGCPEPDDDRDGLLDVDDVCPRIPEDRDGTEDDDGCPEGNEADRDGDGLQDVVDECPDDPEDRDEFEDEEGCPDPDNDADGRLDPDDLCPDDPEDVDRFDDLDGCPDPDNDDDRILDVDDTCPDDPERYNGTEDEDGCPDTGIADLGDGGIGIMRPIEFETDSAVIRASSFDVVDAVAATMRGNPQVRLVEVQGHADERAPDDYNLQLTRERAAAVLEALALRGVEAERLRSAGYGERCPRDPRHVAAAWERNRRVEFKVIATDAGPSGVEIACPAGRELIPR